MFPALLLLANLSAAPVQVTVEVVEFYSQKPLVGAKVTLREDAASALEVGVTTEAKGKAHLEVPHLNFKFGTATLSGYLTDDELKPFRSMLGQKKLDERVKRGDDELYFKVWLVPQSWVKEHIKVPTPEAAIAVGNDWARECAGTGPSSIERKGDAWVLSYPCMEVRIVMDSGAVFPRTPDVATSTPLYAPEDALADALSAPLELVTTTIWPGQFMISSCVYRNKKVIVVNEYCTTKETPATGILVMHPEKGFVSFYAEAQQPISTITREDYESWKFSSVDAFPGLRLDMSGDELIKYAERRARFAKNVCSATIRPSRDKNGECFLKSPDVAQWWDTLYRPLLKTPPPAWSQLVKALRKRAPKDGKPDPRGK